MSKFIYFYIILCQQGKVNYLYNIIFIFILKHLVTIRLFLHNIINLKITLFLFIPSQKGLDFLNKRNSHENKRQLSPHVQFSVLIWLCYHSSSSLSSPSKLKFLFKLGHKSNVIIFKFGHGMCYTAWALGNAALFGLGW